MDGSERGHARGKTHLSRLLRRVERGEEIVITRAGKPAARLVPLRRRPVGGDAGLNDPLPEDVLAEFEGCP